MIHITPCSWRYSSAIGERERERGVVLDILKCICNHHHILLTTQCKICQYIFFIDSVTQEYFRFRYSSYWRPWESLPDYHCYRQRCNTSSDCCRRHNICDPYVKVCHDCWHGYKCQTSGDCCSRYPYCHPHKKECYNWCMTASSSPRPHCTDNHSKLWSIYFCSSTIFVIKLKSQQHWCSDIIKELMDPWFLPGMFLQLTAVYQIMLLYLHLAYYLPSNLYTRISFVIFNI